VVRTDAAIAATFSDRKNASKHYYRRTNYRVRTLKTTALVDTETRAILNVHCTTEKHHDTQFGRQVARRNAGDLPSLAADRGCDWIDSREKLREEGVRPLIKHREFWPIDHAHNARIDGPRCQRAMCEIVSRRSSARSVTPCVRRPGTVSFQELLPMCTVHNIMQSLNS